MIRATPGSTEHPMLTPEPQALADCKVAHIAFLNGPIVVTIDGVDRVLERLGDSVTVTGKVRSTQIRALDSTAMATIAYFS